MIMIAMKMKVKTEVISIKVKVNVESRGSLDESEFLFGFQKVNVIH